MERKYNQILSTELFSLSGYRRPAKSWVLIPLFISISSFLMLSSCAKDEMVLKNETENNIIYEKDWLGRPSPQELKSLVRENKITKLKTGTSIDFSVEPEKEVKWDWENDGTTEDVGSKASWTFQDTGYLELKILDDKNNDKKYVFYVAADQNVKDDRDGDGIPDNTDKCPDKPGLKKYDGCPDTDEDGIPDNKDDCPLKPGPLENNGCLKKKSDGDGDGIPDNTDKCPDKPGPKKYSGCPDTDKDGIPDYKDDCHLKPGPLENNGCPKKESDRDGDRIPDNIDKCPDKPGPKKYSGCPDTDKDGIPDYKDDCPLKPGPLENNGCPKDKPCQITNAGYRTTSTKVGWKYDKCKGSDFNSVRSAKIRFDVRRCLQINKMIIEGQELCNVTLDLYENGSKIKTLKKQLLKGKTTWRVSSLPPLRANRKYEFRFTSDTDCIIERKECSSLYDQAEDLIKIYDESNIVGFDFEIDY